MAKRGVPEINAGSMADIAFLLLIFFLVTTTIDHEEGIMRILPQPIEDDRKTDFKFHKRDVFMVYANFKDDLLVEDKRKQISDIQPMVKKWFGDPRSGADIADTPIRELVNEQKAIKMLQQWQATYDENPDDQAAKSKVNLWENKLKAVREIGPYYELPKDALIAFQSDNGTSYGFYVQVHDQLALAIDDLRDEFAQREFGMSLEDIEALENDDPKKDKYETILELVYPARISETTKAAGS